MGSKLLFSVFNTVLRSYSSKLVTVKNCRVVCNYIDVPNNFYYSTDQNVPHSAIQSDIATYEEIKDISANKNKEVLLVDVREPQELVDTGVLPGSINIPLGDVENVLKDMSNEEFFRRYGRNKPGIDTLIVFSCMVGKRSATAQSISQQLGYKNVKNYLGGWLEWQEKSSNNLNVNAFCSGEASMGNKYPTLSYEEVNNLKHDPDYLLIDVRDPPELLETGSIPGSINIPLDDLEKALTELSPSDFKKKYGRQKPGKDFNLIFSCKSGRRAGIAQKKAIALGYKFVYNYPGSWSDWEERTKGQLKK